MLLAIDIGNTLIDFGIFKETELLSIYKTASVANRSEDEYEAIIRLFVTSRHLDVQTIEGIIISSVVPPLTLVFDHLSRKIFNCKAIILGPHLRTGMPLKVDHPSEVGSDLVADAVGGVLLFPKPMFIADLGTANKYIYVDASGAYSGLVIAPGLTLSLNALVKGTASLPEVSLVAPPKVIGKNTADCMNSGLLYGTVFQIEGFAKAFEKEVDQPLTKVLTGGNASYVKDLLPSFAYDEGLLLKGLASIYRKNR